MKKSDIANLSFEEALKQLQVIVKQLENGESTLENSIKDYALGMQLKQHCDKKLSEAKLKVEKIISDENDDVKTELFE